MATIAQYFHARRDDGAPALRFEDQSWDYRDYVQECVDRAALFESLRLPSAPHIGVLLENVPDFAFWLGAAAMCGATIVGINPTRRGAELERDIAHTECQLIVTESSQRGLLDGLDLGAASGPGRILDVDSLAYNALLRAHAGAEVPPESAASAESQFLLLFTSGTSGAPKAVICSQGRLNRMSSAVVGFVDLDPADVAYLSMPMFHSNAIITGWAAALVAGSTLALRRRFSASAFMDDVRRFGATYANYVGKPLTYVLATPARPDDRDHTLRRLFGNEAAEADIARFSERFGVVVRDGYGSTESSASISRTPDTPTGSLGRGPDGIVIISQDTEKECPRAAFDTHGRLLNATDAIGEIVNLQGGAMFEGYWNNPEANAERVRGGAYHTGDLGYRDDAGFFYFAGRSAEWLRVDGENFAGAPIERILARFPPIQLGVVYAVPDPEVGDRVMCALQLAPGCTFDPAAFRAFLEEQTDLGPKWMPTFVRIVSEFPMTETNKVVKRTLQSQRWETSDPVWWRPSRRGAYGLLQHAGLDDLRRQYAERGRSALLESN